MKSYRFTVWAFLFSLFFVASMEIKAQDVINYFYMKGEVCSPVTLSTSNGKIVVRNGDRVDGNLRIYSAKDCGGNDILDITPDKTSTGTGKPTVREYIFSTLYSSNSNSGTSVYNPPVSKGNQDKGYSGGNVSPPEFITGYPYLGLDLGISRMYGEFARLHCCLGGNYGLQFYGGIGKDWVFNGENKDKMLWHAGMGWYGVFGDDENHQLNLGIAFSETAVIEGGAMSFDIGYRCFLGETKRFGIFGGTGFGYGNIFNYMKSETPSIESLKGIWDIHIGICIKIASSEE